MAKGPDHQIVRALETRPKGVPWKIEIEFCAPQAFKCSVKTYMTGLSNECNFNAILLMRAFLHSKLKLIEGCEILKCHGLPALC